MGAVGSHCKVQIPTVMISDLSSEKITPAPPGERVLWRKDGSRDPVRVALRGLGGFCSWRDSEKWLLDLEHVPEGTLRG